MPLISQAMLADLQLTGLSVIVIVLSPPPHDRALMLLETFMRNLLRLAQSIGIAVCGLAISSGPAHAEVIYSVFDGPIPSGFGYVLGMTMSGPYPRVVTTERVFVNQPFVSGSAYSSVPGFISLYAPVGYVGGIDENSLVLAVRPDFFVFSTRLSFVPSFAQLSFEGPSYGQTVYRPLQPSDYQQPAGIAQDENLHAYGFFDVGVRQYRSFDDPQVIQTIGGAGPGALTQKSHALAAGGGMVYALDEPNSRVNRYSADTGAFLDSFAAITGVDGVNFMMLHAGGLYLTDGNGGVNVYNPATGVLVHQYLARTGTLDRSPGGLDSMAISSDGILYLWDQNTSFHVFETVAVPEPGTGLLAGIGLFFATLTAIRRSRAAR